MRFVTGRQRLAGLASVAPSLLFGLAACSSPPPPPPPPTVVNLTLTTTADVNPSASGQGAPVVLRVYQLASSAGFEKAEFYRLYNSDAATLGADVVKKDEFLLPPGTTKTMAVQPAATATALGVFAAYRDFSHATWRATTPIPPNKTTDVTVKADAKGLTITAAPAAPPAKPAS